MVERIKIAVIGVGQSVRGDDAAGLEAVRRWQEKHPQTAGRPDVRVETSELPGLALIDLLEGLEAAVLVDALHTASAPAGTLIRIGPDELSSFTPGSQSAHGWGVAETLQLGRSIDPTIAACRLILIGVVGASFEPGVGLSPGVREALGEVVEVIESEVRGLF